MPNCFQLISKIDKEAKTFPIIDEDICKGLDLEIDPVKFVHGWYDTIGYVCAVGRSFEEQRDIFKEDPLMIRIIDYLDANYTISCWAEIGRRD